MSFQARKTFAHLRNTNFLMKSNSFLTLQMQLIEHNSYFTQNIPLIRSKLHHWIGLFFLELCTIEM